MFPKIERVVKDYDNLIDINDSYTPFQVQIELYIARVRVVVCSSKAAV